jgi:hypothetical protein
MSCISHSHTLNVVFILKGGSSSYTSCLESMWRRRLPRVLPSRDQHTKGKGARLFLTRIIWGREVEDFVIKDLYCVMSEQCVLGEWLGFVGLWLVPCRLVPLWRITVAALLHVPHLQKLWKRTVYRYTATWSRLLTDIISTQSLNVVAPFLQSSQISNFSFIAPPLQPTSSQADPNKNPQPLDAPQSSPDKPRDYLLSTSTHAFPHPTHPH